MFVRRDFRISSKRRLHVPSVAAGRSGCLLGHTVFCRSPTYGALAWRRPPYPLSTGRQPMSRRLLAVWVERGGTRCCCSSSTAGCSSSDSTRRHSTCCSSCRHGSGAELDLPRCCQYRVDLIHPPNILPISVNSLLICSYLRGGRNPKSMLNLTCVRSNSSSASSCRKCSVLRCSLFALVIRRTMLAIVALISATSVCFSLRGNCAKAGYA